ncbi:epoxide hydrolase, soluble (sEH) [Coemansia sp. RSA 1836]|nr:epoxide hydrolase, soluble (sEH) [Coemansia sp. RSA 25]KAJ2503937.1 epoxide hydrolase, soluble (sEH) [Coemansia sp. RSA 2052]KAJ2584255.1 epoxide hydrolase, soluble (sEH) [Coemansia sp. RSA 1836]
MEQEMSIPVNHDDFIHDVAYNFYGTRLATCGSDRFIKVWDWNKQTGQWILNESILAHDSSVIRLSWAHPEFGQVLASCSLDRTMKVWIEVDIATKGDNNRWKMATSQPQSAAVHNIAFAPEYTNLTIAAACSDGKVYLYTPTEHVKLDNWSISEHIAFSPGVSTDSDGPLSLSWCKSRFATPHMIAIGGGKENCVRIYKQDTKYVEMLELDRYESAVLDVDWAPSMGRSYHLIATACSDGHVRIYKFWSDASTAKTTISDSLFVRDGDQLDDADVGDVAATKASGSRQLDDDDEDEEDEDEDDSEEDTEEDSDEDDEDADEGDSDAGNRSSAGSSDGQHAGRGRGLHSAQDAPKAFEPHSELVGDIVVEPPMPVRRVRWNSTGTILVSSSDDGVARMWKMTVNGTWREAAAVTAERSPADL